MPIDLKKKLSDEELEAVLLHKFIIRGAWQEYHIYESDVPKGFPPHIRNDIMKVAKELKRKGLLIAFPHGKEHVWILNKDKSDEIIDKVKRFFPEEYS
jgi:hypothetical protein